MTEKEYRLLTRLELSDDLGYSVSYRGTLSFKQLKAWNEYIEAHSESRIYEEYLSQPLRFKDLRGIPAYLVGTEHYRELTNEYLDTVNILLLRPTSTDRVTFPEWLGSVGLFDVPIAERYGLLDLLYKGLVYRKGVPIAIKEIPKEGAVLLIHEALHREFFGIFRAIVYAEQLRQNLYRRLPYIKLSLSDLESLPENVRLTI